MAMHEIPNEQHLASHKFTQLDKLTAIANVLVHDQSTTECSSTSRSVAQGSTSFETEK